MLCRGRDDEFRPAKPLQLLNQVLRNLGLGWGVGSRGAESSREGGEDPYLLSQPFTSWLCSHALCSAPWGSCFKLVLHKMELKHDEIAFGGLCFAFKSLKTIASPHSEHILGHGIL